MLVEYSSNNSGGSWWLKDEDWYALENAGWKVEWAREDPNAIFLDKKTGRYLGALARGASKEFETPGEAMREFEAVTKQEVSDEGCNCCGPPHNFSWGEGKNYDNASGEECLKFLYPDAPQVSLREAYERLKKSKK